ncbi:MAG TPA: PAS domain S-box protein [Steroidobacteraceae bacterium]|nr:PAS domain S-box protein [Steroidobacteraceae bacterium]
MGKKSSSNIVRLQLAAPAPAGARTLDRSPPDTASRGRRADDLHQLLEDQLLQAADSGGKLQLRNLLTIISSQYESFENERTSLETVMRLASDEASLVTARLERESIARLQAILDHVKDGIIACDHLARIEYMNRTAERYFGVHQRDVMSNTLDTLLPDFAPGGDIRQSLEEMATAPESIHHELGTEAVARHRNGDLMPAEVLVSRVPNKRRPSYIVCVRDVAERSKAEDALKDSEARYRVLVENAPEAIVVVDVEAGRFVDCNENAATFFKMTREQLLQVGPEAVSPEEQPDGTSSFGVSRGYVEDALSGGTPVFEWTHRDAEGKLIPCEVRFVRLPSSSGSLIRASIIDIAERKRAELIAAGERRAFEKIASSEPLSRALAAITEVVERVLPDAICCIRLYDPERRTLNHAAGSSLPREYVALMENLPAEIRFGSCAAAIVLQRQIIVPDIAKDALWEHRREAALRVGLHACWSTPISGADERLLGTFAAYLHRTGMPSRRDLELISRMTQLARIAIERRRGEDALRESERRFRGLFDNVVEGVYQVTLEGQLLSANPALIEMLGYSSLEELRAIGSTEALYVEPDTRQKLIERLVRDGELVEAEYELKRRDGSVITITENARLNRDERNQPTGFEGTVTDITERKRAEQRLYEEKERAEVTLQSIADAVITTDRTGTIDYVNPIAEKLTGWPATEACGRNVNDVVKLVADGSLAPIEDPVSRALQRGEPLGLADLTMLVSRRGVEVPIQATVAPIRDRNGQTAGAVMVFSDVSRERRMKRLLSYQAAHDALTGLINRREFESRLNAAIESAHADRHVRHAMVYVDLDQFKVVNDTCGHPAGDQLLRQVTGLLQARVRANDVLARLGGDEFGVLLEHCMPEQSLRIADGLRQAIRDLRFHWGSSTLQIGASIGIVEINDRTESVATLLSAADIACYSAKDGGRNRVHVYDPASASARHREMRWMSRLTNARDEGRLDLVFQPIVRIVGPAEARPHYELLLRLQDENGQTVLPDEFIPAAERYNLMPSLDRWVVEKVLRDIVPSSRDGVAEAAFTVAINLSGTTLSDPGFLEFLIDSLEAHEPTPGVLCFEVTETAAITNLGHASYLMREMTSRGCLVALDDFGSGLSSFNYLRTLPVHYLKIDGQFVQNVATDPIDRSMVEAIAQIGKAIGIETVAERVETAEVLETLRQIGVGYAQGYLCGMPAPISGFPHRKS